MEYSEFLSTIEKLENGSELVEFMKNHDSKLSKEAKEARTGKGEIQTKLDETLKEYEGKIAGLMNTMKIDNNEQTDSTDKFKVLETKFSDLSEKFTQAEQQKKDALITNEIMKSISGKKINDSMGVIKDAMKARTTITEEGKYTIENKSYDEFLQSMVDSEIPMFQKQERTDTQPISKNGADDSDARAVMGLD